ncbi:PDZ domain-containing protein [Streptomyces aquilus]|uniref:PDZ domain-containing protein n=1 Tax=Streptomyces aquilus TaxID=2548456 RepID=A0A3Q9C5D1_9ACTN|nr:PDZ domain-containing protein [Streptomyces aquilus]AZP21086.1 PDZ domain-containing protein [Streptomyces aquilus]
MEQTALRPKPMPGQEPGGGTGPGPARRPHAARRRGRRLRTVLFALFVGTVLVLTGVGLGTVGATVIGMSKLAEMQRELGGAAAPSPAVPSHQAPSPPPSPTPSSSTGIAATLGVEAVDAEKAGALLVGVHVPGPGYTAGLVRGDVLLQVGKKRVDSAADLARAVAAVRPGKEVTLTIRHQSGGYQQLTAVPGIVT